MFGMTQLKRINMNMIERVTPELTEAFVEEFKCTTEIATGVLGWMTTHTRDMLLKDERLWSMIMQHRPHYLLGESRIDRSKFPKTQKARNRFYAKIGAELTDDIVSFVDNFQQKD